MKFITFRNTIEKINIVSKKSLLVTASIIIIGLMSFESANAQTEVSKIKSLSEADFTASTKSGLVLVDFYADWCRPCKMMKPILEEFAGDYQSQITVASINTDNNKNLSTKYNISGIPCLILFKDGKEVKRIVGYREKAQLISDLSEYIK